jgi:hypothetical protein
MSSRPQDIENQDIENRRYETQAKSQHIPAVWRLPLESTQIERQQHQSLLRAIDDKANFPVSFAKRTLVGRRWGEDREKVG